MAAKVLIRRVPNAMPAYPLELAAQSGGPIMPAEPNNPLSFERRKRARNSLHWPVLLFRSQIAEPLETVTGDLSSAGFHCVTAAAFTPGERLICTLKIPTHDPKGKHLEGWLECKVRVMRVEAQGMEPVFRIAFRIEDYHFIQPGAERSLSWARVPETERDPDTGQSS